MSRLLDSTRYKRTGHVSAGMASDKADKKAPSDPEDKEEASVPKKGGIWNPTFENTRKRSWPHLEWYYGR